MKLAQYIGILLGALYGYGFRLICGENLGGEIFEDYDIYSISFLWVLPIVIALIPILFARKEILASKTKQFLFPFLSVLLFFIFAISSGIEDWLCILILAFPFLLVAGIIGLVLAPFIEKRNAKKMSLIVFLPFLISPIESLIPDETKDYSVATSIIIEADKQSVWENLIEVPEIKDHEYNKGILNYIGVPRPIKSELTIVNGTQYRIGYFTGGLKLYEQISAITPLNYVEFNIDINQSELRDVPTDQHILMSNNFSFQKIAYELKEISTTETELILRCDYRLQSKMNGYANFWATTIIKDFETRLLESLKLKTE